MILLIRDHLHVIHGSGYLLVFDSCMPSSDRGVSVVVVDVVGGGGGVVVVGGGGDVEVAAGVGLGWLVGRLVGRLSGRLVGGLVAKKVGLRSWFVG